MQDHKSIGIILCTHNPNARFLSEQLQSIKNQSIKTYKLYVFDDASDPQCFDLISRLLKKFFHNNHILISNSENMGFARNFINGLRLTENHDYYSYCDQDDIWHHNKLSRAIDKLSEHDLYCSSVNIINVHGKNIGQAVRKIKPTFKNSLIQCIASGNTYTFNHSLKKLIKKIPSNCKIPSHDWITYQICLACGYKVFYDSEPTMDYRLHNENTFGTKFSLLSKIKRLNLALKGVLSDWYKQNAIILNHYAHCMTKNELFVFDQFKMLQNSRLIRRLEILSRLKFGRDSFTENVIFKILVILNKI